MKKIMIVDDDKDILELLKYNLEREGYQIKVVWTPHRVLSTAKLFEPDLIILDIMLPGQNGIELCRALRTESHFRDTFIFFLTARSEHYYQNACYQTGGDDYIEKVTGLKSVIKKVNAVMNLDLIIRKRNALVVSNNLSLDRRTFLVHYGTKAVRLPRPEFELLYFLAQNPGREISAELLVECIWGTDSNLPVSSLHVYVEKIRGILGSSVIRRTGENRYKLAA